MTDSDYPWEVIPDPDAGGYVIRVPDLPGCMSQVENLYDVNNVAVEIRDLWLATARDAGMAIPKPGSHEANVRRLRKLERACKMARIIPGGLKGHYYAHEQAGLDAIGRLLEGE